MATFILEGKRLNEGEDKPGAVFYDSTDGLAFGPVFDSAQDAESFMSFIRVDPSHLDDWNRDPEMSRAQSLYKLWLECGKPAKRPVVQIGEDFLFAPDGGSDAWSLAFSLTEHCFPLFLGYNNNELLPVLMKHKVVTKAVTVDTEHSCFYAYFKTKQAGLAFLERLNKFLRDNWDKAYPEE